MIKKIIIANWKSNPDAPGRAVALAEKIEDRLTAMRAVEVVVAPPTPFLIPVGAVLKKARLGAQNVFWEDVGPYTGETSWHQLQNLKVAYVIIGHSERKQYLGETNAMIHKKTKVALENGFVPIVCVGERERNDDEIPVAVGEQLEQALKGIAKEFIKKCVIAYEPVWAISTMPGSRPDTPENAFEALLYIRKLLTEWYTRKIADQVRIIYGGSVHAKNIASFLKEGKMQGALVGGASLDPQEFSEIVEIAHTIR